MWKRTIIDDGTAPRGPWSPFNKKGELKLTFSTDPWHRRLLARLRGEPIWHRTGALKEDN